MKNTHQLDVLVVYASSVAFSPLVDDTSVIAPFSPTGSNANYNDAYAHFLYTCKKHNLKAGFTTTSQIIGPGTCKCYWTYNKKTWQKVNSKAFAPIIFDKFSPMNKTRIDIRNLLFSRDLVTPFNDSYLLKLFYDKLKTHNELKQFSIPTVSVNSSKVTDIKKALASLKVLTSLHPHAGDFTSEIIVKDRNGAGGNYIYKVSCVTQIQEILKRRKSLTFVLQPFVKFDQGFIYKDQARLTDIRLIYLKDKLVQAYIRMAKEDEFRCNEHKGGNLEYIAFNSIPKDVMNVANKVLKELTTKSSLFALDFIISNNGNVFLLEGNIGPGLDWNLSKKINERKAKQLIGIIVAELEKRTQVAKARAKVRLNDLDTPVYPFV